MTSRTPSYLLKSRLGIWYFQVQISKFVTNTGKRQLFRRSLKTRNRHEALKKARRWIIQMEDNNYEWESQIELENDSLIRGKSIYIELNQLDGFEVETFLDGLSPSDEQSLKLYSDYINRQSDDESSRPVHTSLHPASETPSNLKLTALLEKFITEKSRTWGGSTENKEYRPKVSEFIAIVGDVQSSDLVKSDIVHYKEILMKLPSNRKKRKRYRNHSIKELALMDIPSSDLLEDQTILNHFSKISSFLSWSSINGYIQQNIEKPLHRVIKKKKRDDEERKPFSENDLKLLFNNDYYFKKQHTKASHYWIPLLGLFTGARLNELCQLYVKDIKNIDGIWIADINDKDDKRLKNINSKRQVPLHSTLIKKLKFMDYVESVKNNNERLFPELKPSRDGYSQSVTKWFNRTYRNNTCVGLNEDKKDFHSFRHTLSDYFKKLGNIDEYRVSEILGHKQNVGMTYGRYSTKDVLSNKKKLIEMLKFDVIDFEMFRLWLK